MADINTEGLDLIKYWERNPKTGDFYPDAYDDGEGVWTIGWGTIRWDLRRPVARGEKITRAEAERQLIKEVQRVEDAIDQSIKVSLTPNQFSALCVWGYNCGIGWITGKGHQQATFIKRLNQGDYAAVPRGLLQFTHGAVSGKHYDGLLKRRKQEIKLWLSSPGEAVAHVPSHEAATEEDHQPMPQAVAPAPVSVTKEAVASPSMWASFLAAVSSSIATAYGWVSGVVSDATVEVGKANHSLSGFESLWGLLKVNTGTILGFVTIACLGVVIVRKLNTIRDGAA